MDRSSKLKNNFKNMECELYIRTNKPDRHRNNILSNYSKIHIFPNSTWNILQDKKYIRPQTDLNEFNIKIIPSILSNYKSMKLEISKRKKTGKFTNTWKLNNTNLNNKLVKEEIKRGNKKYLETIEMDT